MLSTLHAPELVTSDEYAGIPNSQIESILTVDGNVYDGESTMENEPQLSSVTNSQIESIVENIVGDNVEDREAPSTSESEPQSRTDDIHNNVAVNVSSRKWADGKNKKKPRAIHFYNKGKCGIDLSDQMASYATSLRKGVKWYRKLATELLLGISVVNSWVVYKAATHRKTQIRLFRLQIASYLLDIPLTAHSVSVSIKQHFHVKQSVRKNCTSCYKRLSKTMDQKSAKNKAKKTVFICTTCPGKPPMCHECFAAIHKVV